MFSEFLSQNILWVGAFVVVANLLILSFIQGTVKGANMVSALELPSLQRGNSSIIVDVSDAKEFANAHIPGAVNFSHDQLTADNKQLKKYQDKATIVVCQSGTKSAKAAKALVAQGFSDVHILRGGMMGWTKENLPVDSNTK